MSAEPLPDFHHALMVSAGGLDAADLAECHGVMCGMICGRAGGSLDEVLAYLASIQLEVEPGSAFHGVMREAFHSTSGQLDDEELEFSLWLPDDDQALERRTDALAQWCTGFLAGLGLCAPLPELSEEAAEALEDMQEIARAAHCADDGADAAGEDEDDDERVFMEIVEYVRVVTLLLREELRGPRSGDSIH